jgi:hypothetical protein
MQKRKDQNTVSQHVQVYNRGKLKVFVQKAYIDAAY